MTHRAFTGRRLWWVISPVVRGAAEVHTTDLAWQRRHFETLCHAHAPFWAHYADALPKLFGRPWPRLVDATIAFFLDAFAISVRPPLRSTELKGSSTAMLAELAARTRTRVQRVGTVAAAYLVAGVRVEIAAHTTQRAAGSVPYSGRELASLDLLLRHRPAVRAMLAAGTPLHPLAEDGAAA